MRLANRRCLTLQMEFLPLTTLTLFSEVTQTQITPAALFAPSDFLALVVLMKSRLTLMRRRTVWYARTIAGYTIAIRINLYDCPAETANVDNLDLSSSEIVGLSAFLVTKVPAVEPELLCLRVS